MNIKIKMYVDELFKSSPETRKTYELKEKLVSNINNKYNELIDMGTDEQDAYKKAIENIDDILQVCRDYNQEEKDYRKKCGIRVSVAVALYILSPVPVLLLSNSTQNQKIFSVVMLLFIVSVATAILIYNGYDKPISSSIDYELYEKFLEFKETENKSLEKRIKSIIGSLTIAIYFIVSFTYGNWHISWVIFILGGVLENIISTYLNYKK